MEFERYKKGEANGSLNLLSCLNLHNILRRRAFMSTSVVRQYNGDDDDDDDDNDNYGVTADHYPW